MSVLRMQRDGEPMEKFVRGLKTDFPQENDQIRLFSHWTEKQEIIRKTPP